jgi:hypothetical protein
MMLNCAGCAATDVINALTPGKFKPVQHAAIDITHLEQQATLSVNVALQKIAPGSDARIQIQMLTPLCPHNVLTITV